MRTRRTKTERGFVLIEFTDLYGTECRLQKSSLATTDAVWLGMRGTKAQILAADARRLGIETDKENGWVPYPLPNEVLVTDAMHLSRKDAKTLIGLLQRFVDTGEL